MCRQNHDHPSRLQAAAKDARDRPRGELAHAMRFFIFYLARIRSFRY